MIFCQELQDPKKNYETRFEPRLPRMSSWKNIKLHTLDWNSGPLHHKQVFCHWTIKARYHMLILVPFRTTKDCHSCSGLADLFPQLGSLHEQLCGNSVYLALMVQSQKTYYWCRGSGFESWLWSLLFFHADILWRLGSNLVFIVPFRTSYGEFELRYG